MVVQNVQELFLFVVSFQFYEMVWKMLVDTGIIAFPFIGYIWENWVEEYRKHGSKIVLSSQRKMTVDVILGAMAMCFFYLPFVTMGVSDFEVVPLNQSDYSEQAAQALEEREQSVRSSLSASTVKVPILFSWFYDLSNSLMYGGVQGVKIIEGNVQDLREFESLIYAAAISDPTLYAEVRRFTNECYVPAKSKYQRLYSDNPPQFIRDILEKRPDDLDWLGSRVLLSTQGLYARCENVVSCGDGSAGLQAASPVSGFAYNPDRDAIYLDNQGHPYCNEWWLGDSSTIGVGAEDGEAGLRSKLITYIREERKCHGTKQYAATYDGGTCTVDDWFAAMKDHIGEIMATVGVFGVDEIGREAEDAALRHFLRNTNDSLFVPSPYAATDGTYSDEWASRWRNVFGFFGSGKKMMEAQTSMQVVKIALPIVQTVLIVVVIVILPLYGVLSGFSFKKAFLPIVAIGFIKFLSVWWAFVSLIDNKVLELMGVGNVWSAAFEPLSYGAESSITTFMWNIIVVGLYLGVPVIGGYMLQNAGDITNGLGSVGSTGMNRSGGGASENTGSAASSMESNTVKSATNGKKPVKI